MAEGAGKITRDLREALLGHDLGPSGRYTLGKTWGADMLRDARTAYKRAESYLLTGTPPPSNDFGVRVLRILLAERGVPPEKLSDSELEGKSDEEILELVRKVGAAAQKSEKRAERAFLIDEVPKRLEEGWEFVSPLNGSMAVLRAPPTPSTGAILHYGVRGS
jgi:hypothetical protein